jgi:hypothetical protein
LDAVGQPISCHIALFELALAINGRFQQHAASEWAESSGGTHHYVHVKGVHLVYKVYHRVHGGEMARVLDVVRTCITFERLEQLVSCLESLTETPRLKSCA